MAVKSLIETVTVGAGGAASIEFTGIPQNGSDLVVTVSVRTADSDVFGNVIIKPNGSTSNRADIELIGNGSTPSTSTGTDGTISRAVGNTSTANTFGNGSIYIANYSGSTAKSISGDGVGETNGATVLASIIAMLWNDTSAITSLGFVTSTASNFLEGTTLSLYKIKYD
jgi:hypothetical protein